MTSPDPKTPPQPRGVGRIRASLAYRSSGFWRTVADRWPIRPIAPKPALDLDVLTFGGATHLGMIREALFSLARTWPALPRVTVATDGSLPPTVAGAALSWWPGRRPRVLDWRELVAPLGGADGRHRDLLRFAERDAMGRKMAAVTALALEGDVLYADVDVLWLGIPPALASFRRGEGPRLAMSTDILPGYDSALVPGMLSELASPPYFCAGFLYARGDFLSAAAVGDLMAFAAERGIGLTEQTILAEADRRLGGERFPLAEVALFEDDRYTLGPSVRGATWAVRHYVGPVRHLFWRDAVAIRLGARGSLQIEPGKDSPCAS
ncbi:MAG TPA: hypothetical protein VGS22_16730 [Thermoanaerobaculia bacterium]|nr:hypothetical protein [Thermoanaerobaculia bacterium]